MHEELLRIRLASCPKASKRIRSKSENYDNKNAVMVKMLPQSKKRTRLPIPDIAMYIMRRYDIRFDSSTTRRDRPTHRP